MKNLRNNPLYSSAATRRSKTLSSHKNDVQSFAYGTYRCVRIGLQQFGIA